MSRSLTATVLMALMALSPGIPALAQQDQESLDGDVLICQGVPHLDSLAGFEACLSLGSYTYSQSDNQSATQLLADLLLSHLLERTPSQSNSQSQLVGLYFIPYTTYSFCFVGTEKFDDSEKIYVYVGRSGRLFFGLDRPLTPSELEVETPQVIQRKARILQVAADPIFGISQLVVYDETEFRLKQPIIVTTPLGYFGDSISREVFLESPDCQAILN
ncbi:hypothetical protein [Thermostichus sp. MS-CIW-26]